MSMKKIIAGICSVAMLATGSMLNLSASAAPGSRDRDRNQEQEATETTLSADAYMGDLDRDVSVGITDIIMMQKYLHGIQTLDEEQFWFADMNFDEAVNIYDFILLKRAVISGEWTPVEYEEEPTETEPTEEPTEEETQPTEPETQETSEASGDFITPPIQQVLYNLPSQGTGNVVIFYIDFPDQKYSYSPTAEQLNQIAFGAEDESNSNYPFESMKAFYERSSKGIMNLEGQAFRYTAKNNMSYYNEKKDELAQECYAAFDGEVDFSQFDGDGDGDIDVTLLTVPTIEGGDEWASDWWPCAGATGYEGTVADGMKMGHLITGNAQIVSETNYSNFTSSYQHEMGHCMGLPDYYRYTADASEEHDGMPGAAGCELMDEGSGDLSACSKLLLGWLAEGEIQMYSGGTQHFSLTSMQQSPSCVLIPRTQGAGFLSEYFLIEYVTQEGNNTAASGNGIRILHVQAEVSEGAHGMEFSYNNYGLHYDQSNEKQRVLRLVNDYGLFYPGTKGLQYTDRIDGSIAGFHWYDAEGDLTAETGLTLRIEGFQPGPDYEPDPISSLDPKKDPLYLRGSRYNLIISDETDGMIP